MRNRLFFLFSAGLFWLLFFFVFRFLFVLYQWDISRDHNVLELARAFVSGSRHDMSIMGYMLLLGSLIMSTTFFVSGKKLKTVFTVMYSLIGIVFVIILVGNLELYRNWGFHVDATVLSYLRTPEEAAASTTLGVYVLLSVVLVSTAFFSSYFLRKFVIRRLDEVEPISFKWIPVLLFITASTIIPIRGGFGIAPMNVGFVYFSNHIFANHVAVNPVWNFSYSLKGVKKDKKEFNFMNADELRATISSLKADKNGERRDVLSSDKPNVLVIVLESFTSKAIGAFGNEKGATPNLDSLSKEGVWFSNFYAIGDRSRVGLVGLLSGYPSLPKRSVILYPKKAQSIPSLCKRFNTMGYESAFYYGGDIRFANMNSYIITTGFERIITMDDFSEDLYNSKWGVHDEYMFNYLLDDVKKTEKPFFKVFFTLSSHEPFDVPMETVIEGSGEDDRFLNSVFYTDKCMGNFIENLKKTELWDNTLVVLVADHGARYINNSLPSDLIKYHIPMLWLGGAVSEKGLVVSKYGCQPDMCNTLLHQLGVEADDFVFGKDLFLKEQKGYAFLDYNNGFGYLDEDERSVFDLTSNKYIHKEGESTNERANWKAILQYLNEDFNAR